MKEEILLRQLFCLLGLIVLMISRAAASDDLQRSTLKGISAMMVVVEDLNQMSNRTD